MTRLSRDGKTKQIYRQAVACLNSKGLKESQMSYSTRDSKMQ